MKVMVKAPWDSEPHGPYDADITNCDDMYTWVLIKGDWAELPEKWCVDVPEPKFPEGFPVKWRDTATLHAWDSKDMDPEEYSWPRAPWRCAPDDALQWLVLTDGTTRWYPGTLEVGDRWLGDSYAYNTEIVHVEER